jgi:ankyrin repeat protein
MLRVSQHSPTFATDYETSSFANIPSIFELLFNAPAVDFSIQDKNGQTPLHIAADSSPDRTTCKFTFPAFVRAAAANGFNFSTLDYQGKGVIHIAASSTYDDRSRNSIEDLLTFAPKIDVDLLSGSSGSTALFYAINLMRIKEAHALLDARANPTLCGSPERNPMTMVNTYMQGFKDALANILYCHDRRAIRLNISELRQLRERMLQLQKESIQVPGDPPPALSV